MTNHFIFIIFTMFTMSALFFLVLLLRVCFCACVYACACGNVRVSYQLKECTSSTGTSRSLYLLAFLYSKHKQKKIFNSTFFKNYKCHFCGHTSFDVKTLLFFETAKLVLTDTEIEKSFLKQNAPPVNNSAILVV